MGRQKSGQNLSVTDKTEMPTNTTKPLTTLTRGYLALALAALGAVLVPVGFFTGINAALNGASGGVRGSEVIFFAGVVCALIALVLSIVAIARRGATLLRMSGLIVSLLPGAFILILFIAARV